MYGAGGYAKTISKKMISETSKNSPNLALEEKYFNMQEQMEGVTSRLERAEHDLDYERAMRDDIIEAEVARRMAEAERRIRQSVEAEYADERAAIDKEKQAVEQQREDMQKSFELMTQQLQADVDAQIEVRKFVNHMPFCASFNSPVFIYSMIARLAPRVDGLLPP